MSLIVAPDQGVVSERTDEEKKYDTKNILNRSMQLSFTRLVYDFKSNFDQVWNNPLGLTPQQVFDSFDTSAAQLFLIASSIQTAINTIVPNTATQTPPYNYTINQDGTVTVGAHK